MVQSQLFKRLLLPMKLLIAMLGVIVAPLCFASEVKLFMDRGPRNPQEIQILKQIEWKNKRDNVKVDKINRKISFTLEGKVKDQKGSLVYERKGNVLETQDRSFSFEVFATSQDTRIKLYYIHDSGETIPINLIARIPDYEILKADLKSSKSNSFFVEPALGFSFINYFETLQKSLAQNVITAKAGVTYLINSKWNLGISGYMTALPLISNQESVTARYLGANFRIGYGIWNNSNWTVEIKGGGYFTTMIPSESKFGFTNLTGPQIYPVAHYRLNNGTDRLVFYTKYAPIIVSGMDSSRSQEIAGGGSFIRRNSDDSSWSVGIDISNLKLKYLDVWESNLTTFTINYGMSFGFMPRILK